MYPYLRQLISSGDVTNRRRIYSALAAAPIPANRDFLLDYCLKKEKNSELRASILRFMHKMEPEKVPLLLLEKLLKDEAPAIALEAMRLYCLHPEAKAAPLMPFIGTPEQRHGDALLEKTAWNAFAEKDAFADALGSRVFEFRKSSSQEVQLYAFRAALAQSKRNAQLRAWIDEALAGTDEMRLALAQDRHPSSAKIPMKLVKDKKVVVRQALCECAGSLKYPEVLLAALKDNVSSVRIAALKSLSMVETLPDDAASKVFALFNDGSFIVRQQAEETFVALAAKCDVAGLLEEGLASSAEKMTRFHALHVARRIGAKTLVKRIATELSQNDSPEIAAASLDALASLAGQGEYAQVIIPFASSKSQLVRQMAARAMGRLQLPGSENALIGLLEKGNSPEVRTEVCEAMGRFPQAVFVPKLVARLKAVRTSTGEERAAAAWALGQTKSNDMKQLVPAAKRLHLHCTKAVIPDVVPMFDDSSVIANAFWTLATLTKRTGNPEIRKCYDDVMRIYGISLEELAKLNASTTEGEDYPRSEMTCCMTTQVRQYFEGKEYTTMPIPTQELRLPVKSLK